MVAVAQRVIGNKLERRHYAHTVRDRVKNNLGRHHAEQTHVFYASSLQSGIGMSSKKWIANRRERGICGRAMALNQLQVDRESLLNAH